MTTTIKRKTTKSKKKKTNDLSNFDCYINKFWSIQKQNKRFNIVKKEKSILSWILRVLIFVSTLCFIDYFEYSNLINNTLYTGKKWEKLSWNDKYLILCKKEKRLL
jgi:hypothetical protein